MCLVLLGQNTFQERLSLEVGHGREPLIYSLLVLSLNFVLDVLQNLERILGEPSNTSSKTEVADLDVAVLVYQNIRGLYITMENLRWVDPFEPAKQVVNYNLYVKFRKHKLTLDHFLQVALHVLHYEVQIAERTLWWRLNYVKEFRDEGAVVQRFEEQEFSYHLFAVFEISEDIFKSLDRYFLLRRAM